MTTTTPSPTPSPSSTPDPRSSSSTLAQSGRAQGEYHLTHVKEGPYGARDENWFKAPWKRNGYAAAVSRVLRSSPDAIEFGSDGSGACSCGGVVVVRIAIGQRGRGAMGSQQRGARARDPGVVGTSVEESGATGEAANGRAFAARGARAEARRRGGGAVARANVAPLGENAEVISIDSSFEEEEERSRARERRKHPPTDRHQGGHPGRGGRLPSGGSGVAEVRRRSRTRAGRRGEGSRREGGYPQGEGGRGAEARDGQANASVAAREGKTARCPAERGTSRDGVRRATAASSTIPSAGRRVGVLEEDVYVLIKDEYVLVEDVHVLIED